LANRRITVSKIVFAPNDFDRAARQGQKASPTGRDANHNINVFNATLIRANAPPLSSSSRTFDSSIDQYSAAITPGPDRRRAKGRRIFARIEHPNTPTTASADVKERPPFRSDS